MAPLTEVPLSVRKAVDVQYKTTSVFPYFRDTRYLDSHKEHGKRIAGYIDLLPRLEKKSFSHYMDDALHNRQTGKIVLADLGCGPLGMFLLTCRLRWPKHLQTIGIGSPVCVPKIEIKGFELKKGNIHFADTILKDNTADFIVSVFTFNYLADPWKTIQGVNTALKRGGRAFIHAVPLHDAISPDQHHLFLNRLQNEYGIEWSWTKGWTPRFHSINLAWQKTKDDLSLPLSYTGLTKNIAVILAKEDGYTYTFPLATYTVDTQYNKNFTS